MAYREVRMVDIDQVVRRWRAGEGIRAIARLTGSDRNTVRRIVRMAEEAGVRGDTPWPEEDKLQAIRQRMGRRGTTVAVGEAEQRLKPRTDQIRTWRDKDRLLLTNVHELLGREGGWWSPIAPCIDLRGSGASLARLLDYRATSREPGRRASIRSWPDTRTPTMPTACAMIPDNPRLHLVCRLLLEKKKNNRDLCIIRT